MVMMGIILIKVAMTRRVISVRCKCGNKADWMDVDWPSRR